MQSKPLGAFRKAAKSRNPCRKIFRILAALAVLSIAISPMVAAADEPNTPEGAAAPLAEVRQEANTAFTKKLWPEAIEAYRKITRTEKNNALAWFRLGFALHADGQYDAAIVAHQRAARFRRFRPMALYNLACAQSLREDTDGAVANLEKAIKAGFRSPRPLSQDPDLANLRDHDRFADLEEAAKPLRLRKVYRQFDFWVGSWDVYSDKGAKIGANVITSNEKGMLLTEHWTNPQGGTGTSINFYDPGEKLWNQIWVDASGAVVRYKGKLNDEGAMAMEGNTVDATGKKLLARVTFTPLDDGRVRQFIERSSDGGATWSTYFNGFYQKQGTPPPKGP